MSFVCYRQTRKGCDFEAVELQKLQLLTSEEAIAPTSWDLTPGHLHFSPAFNTNPTGSKPLLLTHLRLGGQLVLEHDSIVWFEMELLESVRQHQQQGNCTGRQPRYGNFTDRLLSCHLIQSDLRQWFGLACSTPAAWWVQRETKQQCGRVSANRGEEPCSAQSNLCCCRVKLGFVKQRLEEL